jgi:putative spermidine/putrescine transport system ATP-binding protein
MAAAELRGIEVPLAGAPRIAVGDDIAIAVRRDDVELVRPGGAALPPRVTAVASRVQAIEYQGNFVKVMLDVIGGNEFIAYVPERKFFGNPFDVGDVVLATWAVEHARILT